MSVGIFTIAPVFKRAHLLGGYSRNEGESGKEELGHFVMERMGIFEPKTKQRRC